MTRILLIFFCLLVIGCQKINHPSYEIIGLFSNYSNIKNISNPIVNSFESSPSKILIVRRNATESTAEYGVVVPTNEKPFALFFPFGKPNATSGSGACEISTYTLINMLGGKSLDSSIKTGSWTSNVNNSLFSGTYFTSSSVGGYVQFTTSTGTTRIGAYDVSSTSASGFMKVTINGDATLANCLPTAQQFVNNGTLPSNCLTTNGGQLNPTDRLLYNRNPGTASVIPSHSDATYFTSSRRLKIATNLPPSQYTIRFTIVNYSAIGSTVKTVRLGGIWYDDPNVVINQYGVGFEPLTTSPFSSTGSDNNFAFSFVPQGMTVAQAEWMGHAGTQFKNTTSMFKNNVLFTSVPQGNYKNFTDEFKLTVVGYCKHSLVGKVADYKQDFIFSAMDGVYVNTWFKWTYPGSATGYLPQLSVNEPVNKAGVLEGTQDYILTNDDESYKYNQDATTGYIWSPSNNWGMMCAISDTANLLIQDRAGVVINKLYFRRYNQTPILTNDSIMCTALYRFKKFSNADSELAK